MDAFINFISAHGQHAHWLVFASLLLAGFYIPISEDLLIIASAMVASAIPANTYKLLLCIYLGCICSDWTVYWIGYFFGGKIKKSAFFQKKIPPGRLAKIESFYKKHGAYTLLVGRFIPFGVRNVIFTVAGIGKMPIKKFFIADTAAVLCSNSTLFFLALLLNKNLQILLHDLKIFNILLFTAFVVTIIIVFWYHRRKTNKLSRKIRDSKEEDNNQSLDKKY